MIIYKLVLIDFMIQIETKCLLWKYMNPFGQKIKSYDWFDQSGSGWMSDWYDNSKSENDNSYQVWVQSGFWFQRLRFMDGCQVMIIPLMKYMYKM